MVTFLWCLAGLSQGQPSGSDLPWRGTLVQMNSRMHPLKLFPTKIIPIKVISHQQFPPTKVPPTKVSCVCTKCAHLAFSIPMRYFHSFSMVSCGPINSRRGARPRTFPIELGRADAVGCCWEPILRFCTTLRCIYLNQSRQPYGALSTRLLICMAIMRKQVPPTWFLTINS